MKLSDQELYWLAGILEGEGYFGLRSDDRKTAQLKIEMTDEDIVLRVSALCSKITGKYYNLSYVSRKDKLHISDTCVLALYGKDAIKVMKLIVRIMGARRRRKIWQVINGHFEAKQPVKKSGDNIVDLISLLPPPTKVSRRF